MSRISRVLLVLVFVSGTTAWLAAQSPAFDLVIANGRIVDGTGAPWFRGDVGVVNDRITAMGDLHAATAKQRIDAAGLVVSPGFIDMLGQSEFNILVDNRAAAKIMQGVTTEITGEGSAIAPINDRIIAEDYAATADEIVGNVAKNITPKTRILALTWVHSNTGVKIPVRAIADVVTKANAGRSAEDRLIFTLDGVHGLGIDDVTLPSLGCDFFAAGTHKWIWSPRGTGIVWAKADMWSHVVPTIPAFSMSDSPAAKFSPGGFHSFEHRWAQNEGFKLHLAIGKGRIQERLHQLNGMIRTGLSKMAHVDLHTPMSREFAAGITCFDVKGKTPKDVISHLEERGIMGSQSPYRPSCARLAGSVWNTEEQVERALKAVGEMG